MKTTQQPNTQQTTLPTGSIDNCNQGSLKIKLPTSSKYGK